MMLPSARRRGARLAPPPYAIPTTAPYNVPTRLTTPTYDGSGCTVHPDVVDMRTMHHRRSWGGYRFWMAHTPFPLSNSNYENPSILASHDGLTWVTPAGLTNPLAATPATKWNSDTDLVFDPAADQLAVMWRNEDYQPRLARSSNGVTWSTPVALTGWSASEEALSPALVRMEDGSWVMFALSHPSRYVWRWTAPTLEGPWAGPVVGSGMPASAWHIDVIRWGGRFWAIIDDGGEDKAGIPAENAIYVASSADGLAWVRNPVPVVTLGSGGWDHSDLYRGTIQPHEDGVRMRAWYSGRLDYTIVGSWHLGLTHIPMSAWP